MKNIRVKEQVRVIAVKRHNQEGKRVLDFYFVLPNGQELYAFTRKFTFTTYNMMKSGMRLNALVDTKSKHTDIMNLVKYTKRMLPYFVEEYVLLVSA